MKGNVYLAEDNIISHFLINKKGEKWFTAYIPGSMVTTGNKIY